MKLHDFLPFEPTEETLPTLLEGLNDKQKKSLLEETEYYLLCYPQGTGDPNLEDLLSLMYDYFYPEED